MAAGCKNWPKIYLEKIRAGEIPVSQKVLAVYERECSWMDNPPPNFPYKFSPELGQYYIDYMEKFCRQSKGKAGGQLGPASPIEVRERRVQPGRHKAAPPGPAVRLLGRQGRAGAGAVPVVELVGRDGLPLAEQEAVLLRRQAGIAEADQPSGGKALPRQNANHRPALPFLVG